VSSFLTAHQHRKAILVPFTVYIIEIIVCYKTEKKKKIRNGVKIAISSIATIKL